MRKTMGVLVLSLALLLPAGVVLAASEEEKIMMRLDRLEKQIEEPMGGGGLRRFFLPELHGRQAVTGRVRVRRAA